MSENKSAVTAEEIDVFIQEAFGGRGPSLNAPKTNYVDAGRAIIEMNIDKNMLRPGGFISGPTQMAIADHAAYIAIFTMMGIKPMALTSNLNIDFLRPCQGDAIIADARIIKMGRALAVINVEIRGNASEKMASQLTVTYALPKS